MEVKQEIVDMNSCYTKVHPKLLFQQIKLFEFFLPACIKGIRHQNKFYCLKILDLDSNEVWYSSFWSQGPKNHLNLEI